MTSAVAEAPGVAPLSLSDSGSWLCSQDETLRKLVYRIGAMVADEPDMIAVRDAVIEYDRITGLWNHSRSGFTASADEQRELITMTPGEVGRLRMLATLAPKPATGFGVQFSVFDLTTFNATKAGRDLVRLYARAIRIGVIG